MRRCLPVKDLLGELAAAVVARRAQVSQSWKEAADYYLLKNLKK